MLQTSATIRIQPRVRVRSTCSCRPCSIESWCLPGHAAYRCRDGNVVRDPMANAQREIDEVGTQIKKPEDKLTRCGAAARSPTLP